MDKKQFEKERRRQIKALLKASTPAEQQRIRRGQREGKRLRKELEQLEEGTKWAT